jgi:hypothetical protein
VSDLFDTIDTTPRLASLAHIPMTNASAAALIERSGIRQREIALALVRRHPGRTPSELFALATSSEQTELGDGVELGRRLSDLLQINLVHTGKVRRCTVQRTHTRVWHIGQSPSEAPRLAALRRGEDSCD